MHLNLVLGTDVSIQTPLEETCVRLIAIPKTVVKVSVAFPVACIPLKRGTSQEVFEERVSPLILEGGYHVARQSYSYERKVLTTRFRHVVRSRIAGWNRTLPVRIPRVPRLLFGQYTLVGQHCRPLLVSFVRHAVVSIAVVDEDAEIFGEERPKSNTCRTRCGVVEFADV